LANHAAWGNFVNDDRWGLTQLAGLGGALVGYLGLGVAIWNLTRQVLPLIVYLLVVIVIILGIRVHTGQKELKQFEKKYLELAPASQQTTQLTNLLNDLSGLISWLTHEPRADYFHHYTYVLEEYAIHGNDGTYNWTLRGYNAADTPSPRLVVKFWGDRPTDAKALDISVVDVLHPEQEPKVELIADLPYFKSVAILFDPPLRPNDEFFLKVSCRWDNTFTREREHDHIMFGAGILAAKGLDRHTGRLICDLPISNFVMEEFTMQGLRVASTQPHQVESTFHRTILEWQARDNTALFLLRFHKDVSTPMQAISPQNRPTITPFAE
jgi:hypothetical protein